MKRFFVLVLIILASGCARKSPPDLLEDLMRREGDKFSHILENRERYEIQILYTQIDRDKNNKPSFTGFSFNVDPERYFYPASTVKLPVSLLALEKLHALAVPGLTMQTPMFHDSVYSGQQSVTRDTTAASGLPSIEHYIRKILVTSDNDAYNRLYEFVGQHAINARMNELGYRARILHRLERPLSREENRRTEAVRFVDGDVVVYQQPMQVSDLVEVEEKVLRGKGFYRNDSLIQKPFDFTYKNFFSLLSQHELLRALLFPESVPAERRFRITEDERKFILRHMSQLPRETRYPDYGRDTTYYDAYCKFLMFGNERSPIPSNIRIFNKIGDAYGYLIDNAYVVDFENNIEFMLSAVINTNTDEIYNDGKYEYDSLGFPFMRDLGQMIYRHELNRNRKQRPDLTEFRYLYND